MTFKARLHVAAVVIEALEGVRAALLPIFVVLAIALLGGGVSWSLAPLVGLGGVGAGVIAGWMRWHATTYWWTDNALHFQTGVVTVDDTSVPLDRVQALDEVTGPIQRLFGVTAVHVQTAGGAVDGEIVLKALTAEAVAELRAAVGLDDPMPAVERVRLRASMVAVAGLTAPRWEAVVPVGAAILYLLSELVFGEDDERDRARDALNHVWERLDTPREAAVVLAILLVVAWASSFVGAVLSFAGFEVERDDECLRIRRGVVERRVSTIPLARIDAVAIVEGILRRPFGLATLRVETTGWADEPASAQTLFPLVRVADARRLAAELVPDLDGVEAVPARKPPLRAARLYAWRPVAMASAVGAAITFVVPAAWPAIPAFAAIGLVVGVLAWRATRWGAVDRVLTIREQRLARRTLLIRVERRQWHAMRRSPGEARAGLASVQLAIGSGTKACVRHIDQHDADALFEAL